MIKENTFEVDQKTAERINHLATDLRLSPAEIIRRGVMVLAEARNVLRGRIEASNMADVQLAQAILPEQKGGTDGSV